MRGFLYLDFKIEIYIHDKWNAIAKIYQYILNVWKPCKGCIKLAALNV